MDLSKLTGNPEQIKQLISLLSALLPEDIEEEKPSTQKKKIKESPIKTKKAKRTDQTENKFLSMPEARMHKDDVEIDKKLQKYPPTARNRPSNMVEVTCRVCGKSEEIASVLASESRGRYKCNKCSSNPG